jgi:hypothetical protein
MPDPRPRLALFGPHAPALRRTAGARRRGALVAVLAVVVVLVAGVVPVAGASPSTPQVVASGLAGPLSIDVTGRGDVLVAQSFAGSIVRVPARGGDPQPLVAEPDVAAVAEGPLGMVVYTLASPPDFGRLKVRLWGGATAELADLGAHEARTNPDGDVTYGVQGLSPECAAQWPVEELGPPSYTGRVDSNAYKLQATWFGVFVADAGANAVLFVDWAGNISTVAVLPPQPVTIPDDPSTVGLPACAAGLTYLFEPVPTDVELGGLFDIYVSLLPGGPEDASLGARGKVVNVNWWTGQQRTVGTDLLGATDLAVAPRGDIYVTELFGGRVSRLTPTGPETVVELPEPAAVEWHHGRLYVAYGAFSDGTVAVLQP